MVQAPPPAAADRQALCAAYFQETAALGRILKLSLEIAPFFKREQEIALLIAFIHLEVARAEQSLRDTQTTLLNLPASAEPTFPLSRTLEAALDVVSTFGKILRESEHSAPTA